MEGPDVHTHYHQAQQKAAEGTRVAVRAQRRVSLLPSPGDAGNSVWNQELPPAAGRLCPTLAVQVPQPSLCLWVMM